MRTHKIALSGIVLCLALSGLALLSSGCAGDRYQRSTGAYIDDKGISTRVKTALFRDPNVSGFDVHVNTFRGEVQLSGFVDTPEQKQHAASIAQNVDGVKTVVNNLEVKPGPAASREAVGSSGATVQGSSQTMTQPAPERPTTTINNPPPIITPQPTKLPALAPADNSLDLNRSTSPSPLDRTPALDLPAADRTGVSISSESLPDAQNNLDISSSNGRVILRGTVPSEDEKLSVGRKMLAIPGVISVDNQLQVVPTAPANK